MFYLFNPFRLQSNNDVTFKGHFISPCMSQAPCSTGNSLPHFTVLMLNLPVAHFPKCQSFPFILDFAITLNFLGLALNNGYEIVILKLNYILPRNPLKMYKVLFSFFFFCTCNTKKSHYKHEQSVIYISEI